MARPYLELVARAFDVSVADILGPSKMRAHAFPRAVAAWLLWNRLYAEARAAGRQPPGRRKVALMVGRIDPTSARHMLRQVEERRAAQPAFRAMTDALLDGSTAIAVPRPAPRRGAASDERVPAVLTRRVKPKNEPAANDSDAMMRMRGTRALALALLRERSAT